MGWASWTSDDEATRALDVGHDPLAVLRKIHHRLLQLQEGLEHQLSHTPAGLPAVKVITASLKVLKMIAGLTRDIHVLSEARRDAE